MEVLVDGAPYTESCEPGLAIHSVVDRLRHQWAEEGRLLVEVRCDDATISGAGLQAVLDDPLSRYQRVELRTLPARELAADVLRQISGMLEETRHTQSQVVDLLAQGATARGIDLLAGCFSVWGQAQEGLGRALEVLQFDLDCITFEGAPVTHFLETLAAALREIRDALESRDYVRLADVLAYELEPIMERWPRLSETLLREAGLDRA